MALVTVSSARWRAEQDAEVFEGEPGDLAARLRRLAGRGLRAGTSSRCPDGPADDQVLPPVHPFQGPQRLLGRGGDGGGLRVPGIEGLPGRERRPRRGGWRARTGPGRRLPRRTGPCSTSAGSQRWAFAVAITSRGVARTWGSRSRRSSASRSCGQRRRRPGCRPWCTAASSGLLDVISVGGCRLRLVGLVAERGPAAGALGQRAASSPARCSGRSCVRAWWFRIEARSASREPAVHRGVARGPSRPRSVPASLASVTASAILTRIFVPSRPRRPRPARAGRRHRGPGTPPPRCGSCASVARASAPAGAGGKCVVVDLRGCPGVARRVAGDLDRARSRRRGR